MYHNIFLTIYLFGGGRGGGRESFIQTPCHHRLKRAWSLTVGLHPTTLAKTKESGAQRTESPRRPHRIF